MFRLVAIDARLHLHRQHRNDRILRPDVAMAGFTLHPLRRMLPVTEEDIRGQAIHRRRRDDRFLRHAPMTGQARFARWETGTRTGQSRCMASGTGQVSGFVRGVAEDLITAFFPWFGNALGIER